MGDQKVGDLQITWPDNAVIHGVDIMGSRETNFCRRDVTSTTKVYLALCQTYMCTGTFHLTWHDQGMRAAPWIYRRWGSQVVRGTYLFHKDYRGDKT